MNGNQLDLERLRRAFAAGPAAGDCPGPERLWAGARGELRAAERDALLDHVAACAACAEDWRLADELAREERRGATVVPFRRPWLRRLAPAASAAAAAALLIVVGVEMKEQREERIYAMRGEQQEPIRSLVEDPLPRARAVLRWSGPEGAVYDVFVHDEDLRPVAERRGLGANEYQVPSATLARLPAGAKLNWRVEAILPGGERIASRTFVTGLRSKP